MVSSRPYFKEPVMKGHLSCRDITGDIEVSLEDRFYCIPCIVIYKQWENNIRY